LRVRCAPLIALGLLTACIRWPEAPPPSAALRSTFHLNKLHAIGKAIGKARAAGHLPGAVTWIEHNGVHDAKTHGKLSEKPKHALAHLDSIYDVASLTKAVATTPAMLRLWEQAKLGLDDKVAQHLPEFAGDGRDTITIRHLLTHTSGLRPGISLEGWDGHDECIAKCCAEIPQHPPGAVFIYSDINFQLLNEIIRRTSKHPIDAFCQQEIFNPLKMKDTGYNPPPSKYNRIAPTTLENGRWLHGTVHDPWARKTQGIAGHAGLFTTAPDLARFCRMILNGGELDGVRIFKKETVMEWIRTQNPEQKDAKNRPARRALGWDVDTVYSSPRGAHFPIGSFGHTGFTGPSIWIDPASHTFVIFLCNRLHPDGQGNVVPLRRQIGTLAAEALKSPPLPLRRPVGASK
tara:strand:+ start:194 stop:1405 length:1212 start_codon:yes stop_codon:yes gene_type:complete